MFFIHLSFKFDVENALNSARHTNIFQEILNKIPAIARFFRWKYGGASVMRDNFGKIVAHTRAGVGQGDPWGSLFLLACSMYFLAYN